ncbi:hypothetical protein [uncultured Propionibacterium sp.]|nr:hypothetical protein [uncultured Propionibacterium sp.]
MAADLMGAQRAIDEKTGRTAFTAASPGCANCPSSGPGAIRRA